MKVNEEELRGQAFIRMQALDEPSDAGGISTRPVLGDTGRQGKFIVERPPVRPHAPPKDDARGYRQPSLKLLRKNRRP